MRVHPERLTEHDHLLAESGRITVASRQAAQECRAVIKRVEHELARARAAWQEIQLQRARLQSGGAAMLRHGCRPLTPAGPRECSPANAKDADPGLLTVLQRTALKHCINGGTLAKFGLKGIPAELTQRVLACSVHTVKSLERRRLIERAGPAQYRLTEWGRLTAQAV
ncbi:MAG: hypothetical protein J0I65_25975 [Variovorax sp.]|nr:hypothetical protein [Variovorax sp.]